MVRWLLEAAEVVVGWFTVTAAAGPVNEMGWYLQDDETLLCNVGSACIDELRSANGSEAKMWPQFTSEEREHILNTERLRLTLNKYQPSIVPTYTKVGYKKERLNPVTYTALMEWYTPNADIVSAEAWYRGNSYFNHWEVSSNITMAPSYINELLFMDLEPLMEEWAGLPLAPKSCYGVRIYGRDSVLANHVDRIETHVISAIINVAQSGVEKEWPLFVRGHDGKDNEIFIQPGDIVFYESASVLHGRPTRFEGESFANIFVHFAPQEGWSVTLADVTRAEQEALEKQREGEAGRAEL